MSSPDAVLSWRAGHNRDPHALHAGHLRSIVGGLDEEAHHDDWRARRLDNVRVLIYSHDTFGLGHLRRCQAIAHALVDRFKGLHVLIISGSPIASSFEFRARVDFVKIPSVIKNYNGEYTSLDRHIDLTETLTLRRSIIYHTAVSFDPTLFIVDKEPLGLRGEVEPTLTYLKGRDCLKVLGLRDVMDSPRLLSIEWGRQDMLRKLDSHYDDIWVYGPEDFWDPFTDLGAPEALRNRLFFTGFLRRDVSSIGDYAQQPDNMLLVTAGGGGDGAQLMRQVLAAYDHDPTLAHPLVMVLGPFMSADDRREIVHRAERHPSIRLIDFESRLLALMNEASGVVSMAGYNTFCEILSLDKRALMVPRVHPREEQLIRATRAAELGLFDMLAPGTAADPAAMAAALKRLPSRSRPSQSERPVDLDGMQRIADRVGGYFDARRSEAAGPFKQRLEHP